MAYEASGNRSNRGSGTRDEDESESSDDDAGEEDEEVDGDGHPVLPDTEVADLDLDE